MTDLVADIKPRFTEDRPGWNRTWEKLLDSLYPDKRKYRDQLLGTLGADPCSQDFSACDVHNARDQRQQLLETQQALREYMLYHPNFESSWMGTPRARQNDIILEGLVRTCEISPDMESRRFWVPESRLAVLAQRGGRAFLDIIAQIENAPPHEPYLVPHRIYDATMGVGNAEKRSAEEKLYALSKSFLRNVFICTFLYNSVLAFHGEKARFRMAKADTDKKLMRRMKTHVPGQHEAVMQVMKLSEWCCRACGDVESSLPRGQRLLSCAKCKAVGRAVKYCGRECQKRDWGMHKARCGKSEIANAEEALGIFGSAGVPAVENVGGAAGDTSRALPPPVPPFVRSRYLKYQLQLLQDHPQYQYVYLRSTGTDTSAGFSVDEGLVKDLFLSARERAFQSGDTEAIIELYAYLVCGVRGDSEMVKELRKQLCREYGIGEDFFARPTNTGPLS